MNLIYIRNVGYGVREIEDRMAGGVLKNEAENGLDDDLERAMKKLLEWMAEEN